MSSVNYQPIFFLRRISKPEMKINMSGKHRKIIPAPAGAGGKIMKIRIIPPVPNPPMSISIQAIIFVKVGKLTFSINFSFIASTRRLLRIIKRNLISPIITRSIIPRSKK